MSAQLAALAAACVLGTQSVTLPLPNVAANLRYGWHVSASIGGGPFHGLQVDTGSRGVAVPRAVIGTAATPTGTPGQIFYSSSGRILKGTYYQARMTFRLDRAGDTVSTVPIRVLAVDRIDCAPGYPECTPVDAPRALGMLGVGFDRGRKGPGAAGGGPAVNPFLRLQAMAAGTMHPGYIIAADRIILGLTAANTQGFREVALQPSPTVPGDWRTTPGCFTFPGLAMAAPACGTMLFDTGLRYMILALPSAQRPPAIAATIPNGTAIAIAVPDPRGAALAYRFVTGAGDNPAAAPPSARWSRSIGAPFVNTGRNVIAADDYLYDAGCGRVGFRPSTR